jgi:hypothetical protein
MESPPDSGYEINGKEKLKDFSLCSISISSSLIVQIRLDSVGLGEKEREKRNMKKETLSQRKEKKIERERELIERERELIDYLLMIFQKRIFVSKFEMINSKLGEKFQLLLDNLSSVLSSNFLLNLKGSIRRQSELDVLTEFQSINLKGIMLSSTARLSLTNFLSSSSQSNTLHILHLDGISLTSEDSLVLSQWLQSPICSLKELSLRSCGFSRQEENFSIILSSLSNNTSLISLDLSDNLIRDDEIGASCLHLLRNKSLKRIFYEWTHISPQVYYSPNSVL